MRQRIVINVNGPGTETVQRTRTGGRKPRRWLRVLAILAGLVLVIVVVAAVGGFLWWRHYQTTPAYTLTLLTDAAQRNDVAEFDKHVNYDELAKNMVASVSQKAAGRYGVALNSSIQTQIDKQVPSLPGLKQTIHDEVVKDVVQFASGIEPRGFVVLLFLLPRFTTISTEGDTAKAKARLLDRELELGLKRDGDRWQVTEFKDDAMVQRVVDNAMKALPAIGSIDSNSPLFKKPSRRRPR
jgi:Protein of unknown function (DUF2939)